jgi:hypothetical protein
MIASYFPVEEFTIVKISVLRNYAFARVLPA